MIKIKELPKGTWKEGDKYCRTCPECDKVIFHKSKRNLIFQYKNKYSCRSCGAKRANEKKKLSMPEDTWENGDKYCRNCPDCDNIISYSNRYSMICAHNNKTVCIKCAGKKYPKGKDNALFIPLPKGCWEDNNKFYRNCPECDEILSYSSKGNLMIMYNRNSLCKECGNKKAGQTRTGIEYFKDPLPIGIWEKDNKFFRKCSECNEKIYYASKHNVIYAHKNDILCSKCRGKHFSGENNWAYKPLSGGIWKIDNLFFRNCPECNDIISYTVKHSVTNADKKKSLCEKCLSKKMSKDMSGRNVLPEHIAKGLKTKGLNPCIMKLEELFRFCAKCGVKIWYKTEYYFRRATKKNCLCVDCGTKKGGETLKISGKMAGKNNPMYGRSPSYLYPIFYGKLILRSTWELEFVKRLEELNIKFQYEPKRFKLSDEITYLPDFYLSDYDKWIEIKGWIRDMDLKKHKLVKEIYNIDIEMINNLDKIKNFTI